MNATEVREEKYQMGKMSEDESRAIVAKNLLIMDNDARFWEPAFSLGSECWRYAIGDVLTETEKLEAQDQYKMVLQIPELVNKINALEGMQIAGRRDGVIVPKGAEDAPDTEAIGYLLKDIQQQNSYQAESTQAFTNSLVTSYPSCIWFDQATRQDFNRDLTVTCEPWNAVLYEPFFRRQDYSDANRIGRVRALSEQKIQELWPDRAEMAIGKSRIRSTSAFDSMLTSGHRDLLYKNISSSNDMYDRTGLLYVYQRLHFINMRVPVWVSPYSDRPEILPPEWTREEVARWQGFHPNYQQIIMPMRVLWETTTTTNGVLLENKMHWFQENEMPAEIYIPRSWDGKFYGMVEFLRGALKGEIISFMERIHSVRMANNDLMVVKNGAIVNAKDAAKEKAKIGGMIIRSDTSNPEDIQFPVNHREQQGWNDLSLDFKEQIDRLSVDRNIEGGTQSSQESAKVVQVRNQQTMIKYSPHLTSKNIHHLRCIRKMLLAIPIVYTEQEVLRYVTKEGQVAQIELNSPEEYNPMTGAVIRVKNNLCGARYDYLEADGDNSVTAKEHELAVFNEILANLRSVADMSAWPPLLLEMPNRMAQDFGRRLQKAQEDAAKAGPGIEPIKIALTGSGEDFLHNPLFVQTMKKFGVIPEDAQPQDAMGQGEAPPNAAPFPPRQAA